MDRFLEILFATNWWTMQSWLLWLKLINLIALFWLRRIVMRQHYPDSRVY